MRLAAGGRRQGGGRPVTRAEEFELAFATIPQTVQTASSCSPSRSSALTSPK